MEYVLEFFRPGEPKKPLEKFLAGDIPLSEAKAQAKSIMRNVKFAGAIANLCVIKTKGGSVVCEVKPDSPRY